MIFICNSKKKNYIKVFDELDKDIETKNKIRNENQILRIGFSKLQLE